jgi:peptide/nickel transport system ATP-binding protein
MDNRAIRSVRGREISFVFQEPMTSLNPAYTVGRQVGEVLRRHMGLRGAAERDRTLELLELVGIPAPARRIDEYPHQLSGGMRQRVMIAIALACDPKVLIADEPTTALDVTIQAGILDLMRDLRRRLDTAIVLITHDLGVVAGVADRVQVMYGGTVVEAAGVEELFAHPRMPYTVGLLGSVPHPELIGRPLTPIHGAPPSPLHLPSGCTFGPRCPLVAEQCRESEPELVTIGAAEDPGAAHATRCHRWSELSGDQSARRMFSHAEIGLHEDPAADLVEEQ